MRPTLNGIDHVHVYVADRDTAERWYRDTLGFSRVEKYSFWASGDGPLVLQDSEGSVHLALFERQDAVPCSAIAFGASGEGFLAWKSYLDAKGIDVVVKDHKLSFSLYFNDPDDNLHEITTEDYDDVAGRLN